MVNFLAYFPVFPLQDLNLGGLEESKHAIKSMVTSNKFIKGRPDLKKLTNNGFISSLFLALETDFPLLARK